MPVWTVENHLETELTDVFDVRIRIIGGEVVVTAAPGPAKLDVRILSGAPVEVAHELEALRVYHPEWTSDGLRRLLEGWAFGGKHEAAVTLTVPPGTQVDITTISASAVASGLEAPLKVNTVSGDVVLKDVHADVDLKTVSGPLDVLGLVGELKSKSVSGSLTLARGSCPRIEARSVSGSISLNTDIDPQGDYSLSTVSGEVGLLLQSEPSVSVDATSLSGSLVTDFGFGWSERRPGRRRVSEVIGEGKAQLSVKTLSGAIRLLRRREAAA
jgi:hypothetical protein